MLFRRLLLGGLVFLVFVVVLDVRPAHTIHGAGIGEWFMVNFPGNIHHGDAVGFL